MELFKKIHLEKRYSSNFQSCNSALVGFCVILCCFFTKYAVTASLFWSIIIILNILCIKHIYVQGRWYMYIFKLFEKKTEAVALDFVKKSLKKE